VVHGIGDDRASSDLQKGLRASLRQGPKPGAKACAKDKSGFESSFL